MFGFTEERKKPKVKTLFTMDDAKKVASQFIGVGEIYQIDVFGSIARDKVGQNIDLIFVVQDDRVFTRFVDLVARFQLDDPYRHATLRQHRFAAFQQIWGNSNLTWRKCLTNRTEDLLEHVDVIVFPWSWRDRMKELKGRMNNTDPEFLENIKLDAIILATQP